MRAFFLDLLKIETENLGKLIIPIAGEYSPPVQGH